MLGRRCLKLVAGLAVQEAELIRIGQCQEYKDQAAVGEKSRLQVDAMTQTLNIAPRVECYPALLRELLRTQGGEGRGTLYCHPERQADVSAWLAEHSHLGWTLNNDNALAQDTLKLITAQGVMTLSWQRVVTHRLTKTETLSLN
ncbi:hypothetical protein Dpoa2040_002170 [Dickeya sp. CFBP 2040]|uniref:HrpE/YscL family type III secretion apparatus protein n=1 Tax=Dickeya sp. CFBP 2040 TaxID=2718531 RepID=UPI001446CE6D|nr:HrpE/YscL family type III secretion apparatus protein [Dickeya sp. CFBP 2040]NKI74888.1 hypothetical protein [Dickeya sp. CFBP 2040]